ncbi:rap guanine nucleotide exchange factor 3 [Protopterus annectens]|uniref:rap guanine nucleotide exchange factor 3 n=1 Tax=Protopterus annectens TaxID=7888 RepID=UPI001CF9CC6E|nr:rap guanine nucleotide exchange factor 3 [Protopterus annectens]
MHLFRGQMYQVHPERTLESSSIQGVSWTPLLDTVYMAPSESMKQASVQKVVKAGRTLCSVLLSAFPNLIRDRKHHFRNYRQCCSGKELVDALLSLTHMIQSRSQAIGIWQVLVDEALLIHVKKDLNFHDKENQFYRMVDAQIAKEETANEKEQEEELVESLSWLMQLGPDALLTMILRKQPCQRTKEELELIFEELLHIKAVSHLSNLVKWELASVLVFESHAKAGTVLFHQGEKGTSWYIIWKGSVNVVTHGKGLVTTLHEGDDFGQLALVNDAPRAATIILREDNCHFLRVDKQDFNRILKDVEANTVRLEEHGKVVLVLEKSPSGGGIIEEEAPAKSSMYTVMAGTPEKILEHLLETMRLISSTNDHTDTFVSDFLLTHSVFMPTPMFCQALLHHFQNEPTEGSDQERASYSLRKRQKIMHLVSQWVELYGQLLREDPTTMKFLEKMVEYFSSESQLAGLLKEHFQDHRKIRTPELSANTLKRNKQVQNEVNLFASLDDGCNKPITRPQDKILYDIYRPDLSCIISLLPVNASVQDVIASVENQSEATRDLTLVKVSCSGDRTELKLDDREVYTSLGLNERLFICTTVEMDSLIPHPDQFGPRTGTADMLELYNSRDLANQLNEYDWELFNCIHEVELLHYVFGPQNFRNATTANLDRFIRHFNELQFWVVTELCLCSDLNRRAQLLRKFIKVAAILREHKNLNSFFALMFGLSNSAVSRLAKTWERLPNKTKKLYSTFEALLDPSRNHRAYRLTVAKMSPPIIPLLPLLLKDMTFIQVGNKTYVDNLINFDKMRMIATSVRQVQHCRRQLYVPVSPLRSRMDRIVPDSMAMRISTYSTMSLSFENLSGIHAYLRGLRVISVQRTLSQLSRELEP